MEQLTLTVSDAIEVFNQTLDFAYPSIVIEGEVASFKVNQGKFVFFDIKDGTGSLGCFMMLFQMRLPLEDGMKVKIVATPKLTARGKFSLTVREVTPVGDGSLKKAYKLLRAKLQNEGLFSEDRKRPLPVMPRNIAVISSVQAAGYADFMRILDERWGGLSIQVAHVQVQGVGAADQIIGAIKYFNELSVLPDVLAIVRGGGSADDLATFNDELLVREIATSRIPTIVGVGHEIDESLADMVADVRAATPSHAAQILTPDRREIIDKCNRMLIEAYEAILDSVERERGAVRVSLIDSLARLQDRLETIGDQLEERVRTLRAYDPLAVLQRGYAVVRGSVARGGMIEIERSKDIIIAEVQDVKQK